MAYETRRASVVTTGPGDKKKKKKISGFQEKSGEVHGTKKGFYKSKAAKKLTDKVKFRTADGKEHATMDAYRAAKAKLKASGKYYKD